MKLLLTLLIFSNLLMSVANADKSSDLPTRIAATRYVLATQLAEARLKNLVCDTDAYISTVTDTLGQAIALDHRLKERAAAETIFRQTMNANLVYREIIGELETAKWEGLERVMSEAIFYGPARGVYGNTLKLEFAPNGKVTVNTLLILDEKPYYKWVKSEGTWSISVPKDGNWPMLVLSYGGVIEPYRLQKVYEGGTDYIFVPLNERDNERPSDILTNSPSECDA